MQCFTELTPPTAVTHSLALPFLSPNGINLVVAKTSLLQIFKLKTISIELEASDRNTAQSLESASISDRRLNDDDDFEPSFLGADTVLLQTERASTTKLVLFAEYALAGTVTSMVHIRTPESKSGGDSLLLSFKDAKLSLVEWDPEQCDLSTVSIHYYEQEDIDLNPWAPKLSDCVNYLTADPSSRCAALKFGVRDLAILPFKIDEDIAMDDWDEELDGPHPDRNPATALTNGHASSDQKPYRSSFVLRLSSLDPNLIHPIHLAFLHEYREPTFGILSSTIYPSTSLLHERMDHLSYMVFTLDLQQKASTTILVVSGLPYDLFKVIALAPPVGGALLVGTNELIHIDQSGKANGVAVNTFAKHSTSFGLADQADLQLRLEGCTIEQLASDHRELLMIPRTGELLILSFRMDGRSVSGLNLHRVPDETGGMVFSASASCASRLGRASMFIGSEEADSIIIGWTQNSKDAGRRRASQPKDLDTYDPEDDDDENGAFGDDDDDLYGESEPTEVKKDKTIDTASENPGDYHFRVHDSLLTLAPIRDITLSGLHRTLNNNADEGTGVGSKLQLVATTGRAKDGALVVIRTEIEPKVIGRFEFQEANGLWTMSAKRPIAKTIHADQSKISLDGELGTGAQFDSLMIVSKVFKDSSEESAVYALTSAGFEALSGTEFDPAAGGTIEAGTLGNGMRVIQVLRSEVRSYDGDLGLAQIVPMFDEETGAEPKIVSASIADPFLLLVRDDASIYVAQCDDDNDLEEIDREDEVLLTSKWISGCLYKDSANFFENPAAEKGSMDVGVIYMFLLTREGSLYVYTLPDLAKPIYVAEGISSIPPTISPDYQARRSTAEETLTEIVVADLGDLTSKSPYLILRAADDDLIIYKPFHVPATESVLMAKSLHFQKVYNPHIATGPDVSAEQPAVNGSAHRDYPMRVIHDLGGYSAVFLPGGSPSLVLKSSKSMPKVTRLSSTGVRGMSGFHTAGCDRGFIYVDVDGIARVSQLPPDVNITDIGMVVYSAKLCENFSTITYNLPMDVYITGTSIWEEFELPKEDDYRREWQREDINFKPLMERGLIKLISPVNWSVIDAIELEPGEIVTCLKSLNLETSETTHERKQLITVGTAISKGEDLPIRGCIYVYEVVIVVPEPERPETNKRLKLIAKEEIARGAVTALSEIGSQGCMVVAQGQKLMVRGLKEDGTLLPVAFMDMNTVVTSLKELPGTGLFVMADALKGVWFAGYTEEPYKMMLFGKSSLDMEVIAAEVLPIGKELYIVVADADCNLHILQFDPEHPKSLHGQVLLQRTTFSLGGHVPTTMTLLPRTKPSSIPLDTSNSLTAKTITDHEILITTTTGAIFLLSPLTESQYRRLGTVANHLSNMLLHPCGLNPKAYRTNPNMPEPVIGGRPIVDGEVVFRWALLGSQRKTEIAGRVGGDVALIREDLESLTSGLGYL